MTALARKKVGMWEVRACVVLILSEKFYKPPRTPATYPHCTSTEGSPLEEMSASKYCVQSRERSNSEEKKKS